MAITKEKKKQVVDALVEQIKSSKSAVLIDFKGTTVNDLEDVRNGLRQSKANMKVVKKTLIKMALRNAGMDVKSMPVLEGEIAMAFSQGSEIDAPKVIGNAIKSKKTLKILGGLMENKFLSIQDVIELSTLPTREELLGKFVGTIVTPVNNFVWALNDVAGRFVRALNAIKGNK